MPIEVKLPSLTSDFESGSIVGWLKEEGDKVDKGELIAEVETDKAIVQLEAEHAGVLGKILVPAGSDDVPVDTVLALLLSEGESSEDLEDFEPSASSDKAPNADKEPQSSSAANDNKNNQKHPGSEQDQPRTSDGKSRKGRIFASPLARRLAAEHNLDLSSLSGRGPKGRILKADVEEATQKAPAGQTRAAGTPAEVNKPGGYTEIPHSRTRRVIAQRLTEAKQSIPHFYLTVDCDIGELLQVRKQVNQELDQDGTGDKVSVNDFIVKAVSLALRKVPDANASWTENAVRRYKDVDVSVAVAAPGGLITPVVRSADRKGLVEISREIRDLADRARVGKLAPDEYKGGGFSISNLGMYGVKAFSAIINPPQSCILAVGAGEERAVVKDGELAVATVMTCTLSVDHRSVDGAIGAEFLGAFKQLIESPLRLVLNHLPNSPEDKP